MMKIAVTGDRRWVGDRRYKQVYRALVTLPRDTFVVLGDAPGVDAIALAVCEELRLKHVVKRANWAKYGRGAGPIRNGEMLDEKPDRVWWFHDDLQSSKGTKNCVEQAESRGIPVFNPATGERGAYGRADY